MKYATAGKFVQCSQDARSSPLFTVTVVIPTFNRGRSLRRCVGALRQDVPTIVVDDGSPIAASEYLVGLSRPNLTIVRKRNGGPASARNAGIRVAKTDFIAFIDDDCVPSGTWPQPLVDKMTSAPSTTLGAGGRVRSLSDGIIARYYTAERILEPPKDNAYLVTANCIYRRSSLVAIHGFDETFKNPGGEDIDLSRRVRGLGGEFAFEERALVFHDYRQTLFDFAQTFFRYGRGCRSVLG